MCGIAGEFHYSSDAPIDPAVLVSMANAQRHRGPDDEGLYIDGPLGFSHRRLSIVDIAGGHQPMSTACGNYSIVFNGEIYNFLDLRRELEQHGHRFESRSDTEVILKAYQQFGMEALARLNGMFAIALWDRIEQRLVLARDPFGIKPLHIWDRNGSVAFASELKALTARPDFRSDLDEDSLDAFLTYQFVPAPSTIWKSVTKVRPGHYLIFDRSGSRTGRFGRIGLSKTTARPDDVEDQLAALMSRAVTRQMMSDVPVGALLSGGVDSAAVVALMRQSTNTQIKTYTVGFEGHFEQNELAEARQSAAILGTDHHEVVLSRSRFFQEIDSIAWHLDEPNATPSALAMYWVSKRAAEDVKVVLTGQGADEPWAGYRRYRGEKISHWYRQLVPASIRRRAGPVLEHFVTTEINRRALRVIDTEEPRDRFIAAYTAFTEAQKGQLLGDHYRMRPSIAASVDYWLSDLDPGVSTLQQQLYLETRLSLPDNLLAYGDRMSMAHSLEARVPLLDIELMDFVENLSPDLKLKGLSSHKYLYRKTIARWLPPAILQRRTIGFATPALSWIRSDSGRIMKDRLLDSSLDALGLDRAHVATLIDDHVAERADYGRVLYSLLILSAWLAVSKSKTQSAPVAPLVS